MSIGLLLISTVCMAISGAPGLLLGRRSPRGQWIATLLNVIGSAVGAAGLIVHFANGTEPSQFSRPWSLPVGRFSAGLDDLGAIFIIPILLISSLGSIYGQEYWNQRRHPGNGRQLRFCWGLLSAAMMLVTLARDGVLFLMAWEIMALAGFFLIVTDDRKPEVRRAGWVYLIAAHFGALCLFAMFGLLRVASGSFELWPRAGDSLPAWLATAIFITGVVGFGLKAGIMPLHVWLPGAHANAPSHVSAILSGVMLKMGIYGIIRVASFLPHPPPWWGATLLVSGAVTGIVGIAFAISQNDFKRLLAYSSIENIGIITIGIGLALLGRSLNHPDWILLGLGGALLHVLNHSLFKPLLFMGAGSVLHETRTRRIDRLGGLGKSMPKTFMCVAIGAVAICGLPPLNGFVSELLIYLGLFRTAGIGEGQSSNWAILAAPALAMIGALAIAAFVKLVGAVFGGLPRTAAGRRACDPGNLMLSPMALLAFGCIVVGTVPLVFMPLIERAVAAWDLRPLEMDVSIGRLVPLQWFSLAALSAIAAVFFGAIFLGRIRRLRPPAAAGTWDCGYARPAASMQYTGSSFAQSLSSMFAWVLLPRPAMVSLAGFFPSRTQFSEETRDVVLDRALVPSFSLAERMMSLARPFQRGPVQIYLLYVLTILLTLLAFAGWTK